MLRGELDQKTLFRAYPHEAKRASIRSWHATLGPGGEKLITLHQRIRIALGTDTNWVLIGGPPCQAYSIAGRSRNQGNPEYDPSKDGRQRLYVEYLQILAEHRPAVFILENVKGLLSATFEQELMFRRILEDLRDPAKAIEREGRGGSHIRKGGYSIHSLTEDHVFENGTLRGSVIESEKYGIPQTRHRVILLGIRDDITGIKPRVLSKQNALSVNSVIGSLPRLRAGISPRNLDSATAWKCRLQSQANFR